MMRPVGRVTPNTGATRPADTDWGTRGSGLERKPLPLVLIVFVDGPSSRVKIRNWIVCSSRKANADTLKSSAFPGVRAGSRVTCVRCPVMTSSVKSCVASRPSGAGPRSVSV
jgi:hypothetical protein